MTVIGGSLTLGITPWEEAVNFHRIVAGRENALLNADAVQIDLEIAVESIYTAAAELDIL
jgi:hypothetical protein